MDTFDVQDKLFNLFVDDTELCKLLSITDPKNNDLTNTKIRREIQSTELINNKNLPFISVFFANSYRTGNWKMNHGLLEIDVYSGTRYNAKKIVKRIKSLLSEYDDMYVYHEGQVASGIVGIYEYSMRLYPLVES